MLLVALGLVIATMRQLNKPSTARRLGALFGTPAAITQQESGQQFVIGVAEISDPPTPVVQQMRAAEPVGSAHTSSDNTTSTQSESLAEVRDNTYFRPAETEAWFGLFERLRLMDDQQLRASSLGELTYAQLLKQPQVYRGKVVTIRGTLRREEIEHPPDNEQGIEVYHRLVVQPRGGGHWPFVVYCLELPSGFPRGDNLQAVVAVTGFFFKNWSYAWQDGLGIAHGSASGKC